MSAEIKFLNDIAKPWDELNSFLVERYALQPDISDVTVRVSSIATAIKHQVDVLAFDRKCRPKKIQSEVNGESEAARLMSDVSDAAKHVFLDDHRRQNNIFVAAMFEVNAEGDFRFIRNGVFVEHASLGCQDFMAASLSAIEYWIKKRGLNIAWSGSVREAANKFFPTAFLHFDPRFCIHMSTARIMFYRRDDAGNIMLFDPEVVRFEVRQTSPRD